MDPWLHASGSALLVPGEVHVWCVSTIQTAEIRRELEACFSPDERARASRYHNEAARAQFVVGRGVLRQLLGTYLQQDPGSIVFEYGHRGKPLVRNVSRKIGFNLSHSGDVVLIGFGLDQELGVDVEQLVAMPDLDAIAEEFFAPEEADRVKAERDKKMELFYGMWTRKEAVLKCSGRGIDDECRARGAHFEGSVCTLVPEPGYMAALAAETVPFCLRTYRWIPDQARYGVHQSLLPR